MKLHIKTKHNIARNCLTNYADRLVGIKLASKLATIKWQKKLQFTITQYNTEQNNIVQIFEVGLMPIIGR